MDGKVVDLSGTASVFNFSFLKRDFDLEKIKFQRQVMPVNTELYVLMDNVLWQFYIFFCFSHSVVQGFSFSFIAFYGWFPLFDVMQFVRCFLAFFSALWSSFIYI